MAAAARGAGPGAGATEENARRRTLPLLTVGLWIRVEPTATSSPQSSCEPYTLSFRCSMAAILLRPHRSPARATPDRIFLTKSS